MRPAHPSSDQKPRRFPIRLAGLGLELAAAVVGLALLGIWIDRRYGSDPWGVVICASIGFVGGLYNFVRAAIRAAEESTRSVVRRSDRGKEG
ncbi:MAG: AtpZ/AtpI family protein [Thermoanaerobaculia bacterium]